MDRGVRRIRPDERTEGQATTGMIREAAIETDRMWAGFVPTTPGMVSGWHHHGAYEDGDLRGDRGDADGIRTGRRGSARCRPR